MHRGGSGVRRARRTPAGPAGCARRIPTASSAARPVPDEARATAKGMILARPQRRAFPLWKTHGIGPATCPSGRPPVSDDQAARARATAEAVYRAESRRVFATLIRLLGDFDLAEEALHDAFRAALEQWPRDGVPANPRAWLVSAGRFKAIDGIRRRARFDAIEDVAEQVEADRRDAAPWDGEEHRGRPAAARLHLLPSGAVAGRAGGAHAARGVRPHDRGDRAGVPQRRADARAAHRARQGEDPRRAHPLPGADAGRAAGAAGQRAARDLPRVQRGLFGVVGRSR